MHWISWRSLPSFVNQEMLTTMKNYLYSTKYKPTHCLKALSTSSWPTGVFTQSCSYRIQDKHFTSVTLSNLWWVPKNKEKNSYGKATSSFITDEVIRIVEMQISIFRGGWGGEYFYLKWRITQENYETSVCQNFQLLPNFLIWYWSQLWYHVLLGI